MQANDDPDDPDDHPDDMSQEGDEGREEVEAEEEEGEEGEEWDEEVSEFGDPLYRIPGCEYNDWPGIERANLLIQQAVQDARNLDEDHFANKGLTEEEMDAGDVGDREDIVHFRNGFILQLLRSGIRAHGHKRTGFPKWLKTVCELTVRLDVTFPAFSLVTAGFLTAIEVLADEQSPHVAAIRAAFCAEFCELEDDSFFDDAANDVDGAIEYVTTDHRIDWWRNMANAVNIPAFTLKLKTLLERSIAYHQKASDENELGDGGRQDQRLADMRRVILQSL